jgi:hypothetical protein
MIPAAQPKKEEVPQAPPEDYDWSTIDLIVGWRTQQLVLAGYPFVEAEEIALDTSIDLHGAVDLLVKGCSHELAMEILF